MIVTLQDKKQEIINKYQQLFNNVTNLLNNWEIDTSSNKLTPKTDSDTSNEILITDLRDYYKNLPVIVKYASTPIADDYIDDYNKDYFDWQYYTMLPLDEEIFEINANTRKITEPASLKNIGVAGDAYVETVFFKIHRYFDTIDFASTDLVPYIEWKRGNKKDISPAYAIEFIRDTDYILIGWTLTQEILEEPGVLEFALRFVSESPDNEILYSYSTLPAKVNIVNSLNQYQAGDYVEGSGDGENSLKNTILNRLINRTASPDSFGSANMPIWINDDGSDGNISSNSNVYNYNKVVNGYYADVDDDNTLTITVNAKLQNGLSDKYAKYQWYKFNNGQPQKITQMAGSETLNEGNEYIGYSDEFTLTKLKADDTDVTNLIGHYRCSVEEIANGLIKSRAESQNLYILGPEEPQPKVYASGEYVSKILQDGQTSLEAIANDNYPSFYDNSYDEKGVTKVIHSWTKKISPDSENAETVAKSSEAKTIAVTEEGYYQNYVNTERNGAKFDSTDSGKPGILYRVTENIQMPDNNSFVLPSYDSEMPGQGGITDGPNKEGYVGETIIVDFTAKDYKYDKIYYQWYRYENTNTSNLYPVIGAYGEDKNGIIKFTPERNGYYVVAIRAERNTSWTHSNDIPLNEKYKDIPDNQTITLTAVETDAILLPRNETGTSIKGIMMAERNA